MKTLRKYITLFLTGGCVYLLLELLWRGYTHWSMGIVGGLAFLLIGSVNEFMTWDMSIQSQMFVGCIGTTSLELISGLILNTWLGLNIWDYSNKWINFFDGNICIGASFLWFWLSGIGIVLDDFLRWKLFDEEKPHYHL